MLRSEMIEPGDVFLMHGGGWESKTIATFSAGPFSHAALVVNQAMLFESDGGIIGHKAIHWLGSGEIAGKPARLARLMTDPKRLALYRHPDLRKLPPGAFEAALRAELDESYGRDYSEMYRLVPLANFPDWLKPLVADAFKRYERNTLREQIPGPFCSELVSRVYERMGLALFRKARPPAEISPNDLAKSNLIRVEGAVVSSSSVVHYVPMESSSNIAWPNVAEKLYPASGDRFAQNRHADRNIAKQLSQLDEIRRSMREQTRVQLTVVQSAFQQQIENAVQLLLNEQANGNERLTHWALRLCTNSLEFAPDLAALATRSQDSLDMENLRTGLLKVNELGTSFFRCSFISESQRLRRSIATSSNPIRRYRLRKVRQKALKTARQHVRLRSEMRSFVAEWFEPSAAQPHAG
jgi:hypothetical protein